MEGQTLEVQLEILKQALEMGGEIDIKFHRNTSLKEAKSKADKIAKGLGIHAEYGKSLREDSATEWYHSVSHRSPINVTSYFTKDETLQKAN